MAVSDLEIQRWAQKAFNKYNGGYSASDINLNAVDYLYGIRNEGNGNPSLAIASHYIHFRYIISRFPLVGDMIGGFAALGYDGLIKGIETIWKQYSPKQIVHQFGKAPTSTFSLEMIHWDIQGFNDGDMDFLCQWGNTYLYAPPSSNYPPYNTVNSIK